MKHHPEYSFQAMAAISLVWAASILQVSTVWAIESREDLGSTASHFIDSKSLSPGARVPSSETPAAPSAEECGTVELRDVSSGSRCKTAKGGVFERVSIESFGESWKGPDGLVWSDVLGQENQFDAELLCKKLGAVLPSQEELNQGESYGFREVLPKMDSQEFWSSTVYPHYSVMAFFFKGQSGLIDAVPRQQKMAVRCVTRQVASVPSGASVE